MVIHRLLSCAAVAAVCASLAHAQGPAGVAAGPPTLPGSRCRVEGHVTSGQGVLPGASVVVHVGDALKAATSTDIDGKYAIVFAPNATYRVSADLTAFTPVERAVTLAAPPCDTTVDFELTLKPRHEPLTTTSAAAAEPSPRQEAAAPSAQQEQAPDREGSRSVADSRVNACRPWSRCARWPRCRAGPAVRNAQRADRHERRGHDGNRAE